MARKYTREQKIKLLTIVKAKMDERRVAQLKASPVPLSAHLETIETVSQLQSELSQLKDTQPDLTPVLNKIASLEKKINTPVVVPVVQPKKGDKGDPGEPGKPGEPGEPGRPGKNGVAPTSEEVAMFLLPLVMERMPTPQAGAPGKDAETPEVSALVTEVIKELQKGDKLHISHVKGAAGFIKDGIKYRYEEMMHGAGKGGSTKLSTAFTYNVDRTVNVISDSSGTRTMVYSGGVVVQIIGTGAYPTETFTYNGDGDISAIVVS